MDDKIKRWPSWRYGPQGEAQVFASAGEVPAGWKEHPSHFDKPEKAASTKAVAPAKAPGDAADVDAAGWEFDPALHASTKTKTSAGLWRMKVGVSRPAAKKLDL